MKISRQVGTVSEVLNVFVNDVTVTTGAGLANIVASSVAFTWLRNDQATFSSGTCSSGGTIGTYGVSSLTQVSSTSSLGWYQFGVPNGIFASGRSALLHLYNAPNMVPVPIEVELTKFDNQSYVSTYAVSTMTTPVGVSSGTWVPSISSGVGVSSFTIAVGVSSAQVGVSTLVGVSSGTWQVGVSSGTWVAGVSTVTDKAGYGVSTGVGVSSFTIGVGVSSVTNPVGVSSGTWLAGVSTITDKGGYGVSTGVGVSSFTITVGVSSNADKTSYTLDSTYGPAGSISTNIVQIAGATVIGAGTSGNLWRA